MIYMFCLYNFSLKSVIKNFYLSQDDPLKSGPPLMRGLNIPVSITKLMFGLRVGLISSHLIADKLFPVNPRAIMGPLKMSLLLEAKSMPALIVWNHHKFGTTWAIEMTADKEEWFDLPIGATTATCTRSETSVIRSSSVLPRAWVGPTTNWLQPETDAKSKAATPWWFVVIEPNHSWWWPFKSPTNRKEAWTSSACMAAIDVSKQSKIRSSSPGLW